MGEDWVERNVWTLDPGQQQTCFHEFIDFSIKLVARRPIFIHDVVLFTCKANRETISNWITFDPHKSYFDKLAGNHPPKLHDLGMALDTAQFFWITQSSYGRSTLHDLQTQWTLLKLLQTLGW